MTSPCREVGIISAHPGRTERIAHEFLNDVSIHTDFRGYKVYTGTIMKNQFLLLTQA